MYKNFEIKLDMNKEIILNLLSDFKKNNINLKKFLFL